MIMVITLFVLKFNIKVDFYVCLMAWFGLHHSEKLPQVIINLLVVLDLTIRNNQNLGPGVNELLQFGDKFGKKYFPPQKAVF